MTFARVCPGIAPGAFFAAPACQAECLPFAHVRVVGMVRRALQKGQVSKAVHASTFVPGQPVTQPVIRLHFFMGATMEQMPLRPLMGRLEGPAIVPASLIAMCATYRDAVRLCWERRRVHYMTKRQLAAEAGLLPQHVTDYLHPDDKPGRRDLPGDRVAAFEAVCGNTAVSQWHAHNSRLTVLEELQAERLAA
jgi:hypothetical protein